MISITTYAIYIRITTYLFSDVQARPNIANIIASLFDRLTNANRHSSNHPTSICQNLGIGISSLPPAIVRKGLREAKDLQKICSQSVINKDEEERTLRMWSRHINRNKEKKFELAQKGTSCL